MSSKGAEAIDVDSVSAEAALIGRIQNGSREEFRVLVQRYQSRVYSVAYRLMGDPEEAEDIAQEAFLRAYRNLGRFQGQASFYTWVYRITTNLALSRLRYLERRGRGKSESVEQSREDPERRGLDPIDTGPNPREQLIEQDLEKRIGEALGRLPTMFRIVVVLRDIENKSYEEVARLTGLPLGTVKSRLHEGRAKLQQMLAEFL